MNLPNRLTILRVVLIPFFLFFLLTDYGWYYNYIALGIYAIACLTDMLDGKIARKYNLITNFGKFMDPLADKLLVCSALICFSTLGQLPAWVTIIIIAREFIISGFRLVASDKGVVIAASMWGKIKTVTQMILTILLMLDFEGSFIYENQLVGMLFHEILIKIFIYVATTLTVVSLVDYIFKNKDVLKENN